MSSTRRGLSAWLPPGQMMPERTAFIPVPESLPDQGVRGIVFESVSRRAVVTIGSAVSVARRARRWSVPYAARRLGISVVRLRRLESGRDPLGTSEDVALLRRLWDGDE